MKQKREKQTFSVGMGTGDGKCHPLFRNRSKVIVMCILVVSILVSSFALVWYMYREMQERKVLELQQAYLKQKKEEDARQSEMMLYTIGATAFFKNSEMLRKKMAQPVILPEYESLYAENNDLIGWLTIEDTVIDYPVMQTIDDENYYLYRDFNKDKNSNGSLILDTDSVAGVGTVENDYANGERPSTNLIIHGHTMRSGLMFGNLKKYKDKEYGKEHKLISFDSLYEHREYELIAVFYSQVYYESDRVFKYYKFFQADTPAEFDDWYSNIKELSLYDTGVSATYGDEFITLSCCAYHVEDGRFVVVGKRIK